MFKKAGLTIILAAAIFLTQQFLGPVIPALDLFIIFIIWFSLKRSDFVWYLAVIGGLVLDIVYSGQLVNLLTFLIIVLLIKIFTSQFSLSNFFARLLLIVMAVTSARLLNYCLAGLINLVFKSLGHYQAVISWVGLVDYILINSLVILVLVFLIRPKINSSQINYAGQ